MTSDSQPTYQFFPPPSPADTILPLLRRYLPHTIPLYRRFQFHLRNPLPTAHILASFPPGTTPDPDANKNGAPWLVTHVDLSRRSETQAWLFSSLELELESGIEFTSRLRNGERGVVEDALEKVVQKQLF